MTDLMDSVRPSAASRLSTTLEIGTIAPGAHIEIRDAVWRVVRVDVTSTGKQAWRCVGVSEIVREQEAVFLQEYEPRVKVLDPKKTALVRDASPFHRAGLLYIESLLRDMPPRDDALSIGPGAAMDVLDFQLEPAWRALQKPRQRILIADAVGLGKTLEAGILLSELIRRGRGRRILVVTVKSMLVQFQKEMWARFGIPLTRLDSDGLLRIRRDLPTNHNPFYYFDRSIISVDTLKSKNWFQTHVEQARWDVIVIDEAHNVAVRGSGASQRARIADVLSHNCDSLIMLSATPHDGRARSFASLMNMLDPTAIADPDNYGKEDIEGLFVRRFKKDVGDQLAKKSPKRTVSTAKTAASGAEERAFETLANLSFSRIDQKAHGGLLFKTTLEKALFSSPAACLSTIENRIKRLESREDKGEFERDVTALRTLAADVRDVEEQKGAFSKYGRLVELIKDNWKWVPQKAQSDRIVIFTESRVTLTYLKEHLPGDLGLSDKQWAILHGSLPDKEQNHIVERFGQEKDPVRLLLATDVAAEGLNLHYQCHRLVHFDVPWSLMVFQQRNGRIDRYGQESPPHIVYMLTEPKHAAIRGDVRILELLIEKDDQAQKNIGDPSAFMNVYDIEEEEKITARAMEADQSAEEFDKELEQTAFDPFALMLGQAAFAGTEAPPVERPLSLFESEYDYLKAACARLSETIELRSDFKTDEKLAEIKLHSDFERRMKKLPPEVQPKDGVLLLTADPGRMQRALEEARREEEAWPRHHYLWAGSPLLEWIGQTMRGEMPRHSAPVLEVDEPLKPGETVVIVSGLLPNQRAQPLVHRWYAVGFEGKRQSRVEPFGEFLSRTRFGGLDMPNAQAELPIEDLQALLPAAVEAAERRLAADREDFVQATAPKLKSETERLEKLKARQLAQAELAYGGRTDALAVQKRDRQRRRVEGIFKEHHAWVRDAMTVSTTPFIQIVAVLHKRKAETKSPCPPF